MREDNRDFRIRAVAIWTSCVLGVGAAAGCETIVEASDDVAVASATGGDGTDGVDGATGVDVAEDALPVRVQSNGIDVTVGFEATAGRQLVVTQGDAEAVIAVTDGLPTVEVTAAQLAGFIVGPLEWRLEAAGETLSAGQASLAERFTRFFEQVIPESERIELPGLPLMAEVGDTASVSASPGTTGARGTVYIGTPAGPVTTIEVAAGTVPSGGALEFQLSFDQPGMYVVEVLAPAGTPIANLPVYVGSAWPLLAPPLDVLPSADLSGELPMAEFRTQMVSLLNGKRVAAGLGELASDAALDSVSQEKAQVMADEQYLSHTSKEGVIVSDRLVAAGLSGPYRENIAAERSAARVFWTWWWSPSHRQPYMEARWTRTGLGGALYQPGLVAFAQHFME